MRFPFVEQLALPCTFERLVPGQLHADGRRYLPLLIFRLDTRAPDGDAEQITPPDLRLGVVDRHHVVDQSLAGTSGVARLTFMLGRVQAQTSPYRQGLEPEAGRDADRVSTQPRSMGRITRVPAWEVDREHLSYEYMYTELLIDIGFGTIGVRASATAEDIVAYVGKDTLEPGDWVEIGPSRIDILGFSPSAEE